MTDPVLVELTAAARAYEDLHVPAIFAEWSGHVLNSARVGLGQSVLDVACGTGVLARAALGRTGPDGSVAGVDPNAGMLAVAGELEPAVDWREGTAESIPFPDESFDAVVSQFGMMFFPDRIVAVTEMLRVLKPGGMIAVAVWDGLDHQPAYSREVDLLERLGGPAAADALRAPFVLGDPEELVRLLAAGGVESPRVETRVGTARFPSIRIMVEADLRGWLPVIGVTLTEDRVARILAEAETVLSPYVKDGGEVVFDSPAHIASGSRAVTEGRVERPEVGA